MSDERMSDAAVADWHEAMRFASTPADGSPIDRVLRDHLRARRVETELAQTIRTLSGALESMTHMASGLFSLYRGTAKTESDGSHEAAFANALELVKKARGT